MKIFNHLQSYLDPVTNKMKYFQLKQAHKSYLSFKILKIYTHVLFILICWNKILVSNRTIQPICFTDVKATLTLFICMLFTNVIPYYDKNTLLSSMKYHTYIFVTVTKLWFILTYENS